MADLRTLAFKAGLEAVYFTGIHRLISMACQPVGVIFSLHRVYPGADGDQTLRFNPNGPLDITDTFLDEVLVYLEKKNIEFVSLEEAVTRLKNPDSGSGNRFAAFTLDDGYLDNRDVAWPIFKKHECPFTVFVTTQIVDGTAMLWWYILEEAIKKNDILEIEIDQQLRQFDTSTLEKKKSCWEEVYWHLRGSEEIPLRETIRKMAQRHKIDTDAFCRNIAMTWDHVRTLNDDPLATIGAHTISHSALNQLSEEDARVEMIGSRERILAETRSEPKIFCYPYGDKTTSGAREFAMAEDAGFEAAVTTRKGMLYDEHKDHLFDLPRVSLNGSYQQIKYVDLYMSGAPFLLYNKFNKVCPE